MSRNQDVMKLMVPTVTSAIGLSIVGDYSLIYCLMGMLVANIILQSAYNYTESSNRPILFTLMFTFYIFLSAYSKNYAVKYVNGIGIFKLIQKPGVAGILCLSCITIVLINLQGLKNSLKRNIYLWLPYNYIFIFIAFVVININDWVPISIKRASYFIIIMAIVILCFARNEIRGVAHIKYEIPFKTYFKYGFVIFILILAGTIICPKPEYLPGARLLQRKNRAATGDADISTRLNRNPQISDEILFKVCAEEPLYLRTIAYSDYRDGAWFINERDTDTEPLIDSDFRDEFDILYSKSDSKMKNAYIIEFGNYKNYLTVNGIKRISPDNYINIVGDMNNICFKEDSDEETIAYTIEYYDKQYNFAQYEDAPLHSRSRYSWLNYMKSRNLTRTTYLLSETEYSELIYKYTQIPSEIYEPINELSLDVTGGVIGQIQEAKKIEDYLKFTGGYKYILGAPKSDKFTDTVYDFIFNGKEGICQDFASAMTLMCRSMGIPSRYVVGYYSDEVNSDGDYIVRSKHAHAFVEVYISGYGWMLFDPTPPSSIGNNVGINSQISEGDKLERIKSARENLLSYIAMAVIVIVIILSILIFGIVEDSLWKKKVLKMGNSEAIIEIYSGLIRIIERNNIQIQDVKNTTQLTDQMLSMGINISDITRPFEDSYYGNKPINKSDIDIALNKYEELKQSSKWTKLMNPKD